MAPLPYRDPEAIPDEPPDLELLCARALHRKAELTRKAVVAPCVVLGLFAGALGYLAVREICLSTVGFHYFYLSGILGLTPPFVLAIRAARALGDVLVRRGMPRWTEELASRHGVSREVLEEHAEVALGSEIALVGRDE